MQGIALSPHLGIELTDVDLTKPLTPDDIARVRRFFIDHHLLVVRGQNLSPEDQDRFTGYLGTLHVNAKGSHVEYVSNRRDDDIAGLGRLLFHNDKAWRSVPAAGTSLYALDVSEDSAPTTFVNCVRAYGRLDPALKRRVDALSALHMLEVSPQGDHIRVREPELPADAPAEMYPRAVHPIALPLLYSDRRSLFVSEHQTSHIVELPLDEGEALLQELFALLYQPEEIVTFRWTNNDLVIWDNLALQHGRPARAGNGPRHLRRLSLDAVAATPS